MNKSDICPPVSKHHLKIERGIPIPLKNVKKDKRCIFSVRASALKWLKLGKTLKIFSNEILKEKSRYTAIISKHRKKINWAFTTKIHDTYLTITRIK